MFQKLQHSDICNQVKSCTKNGRHDQSKRELTVALSKTNCSKQCTFSIHNFTITHQLFASPDQRYKN